MNNLSLTTTELERLVRVLAAVACVLFAAITTVNVYAFSTPTLTAAWRALSPALFLSSLAFAFFTTTAWKWPLVAKWMRRPLVHGVWTGTLNSDYGSAPKDIPIVFVVRQTYLTLSVQSFTSSQEGESRLEALIHSAKTEATRLSYVFEMRRPYAGERTVTSGAGELKLLSNDQELRGRYWTDSPTHGELSLRLVSRKVEGIACFADAVQKWPSKIQQRAQPISQP
jgi:SMODS-associating 2TM, beta-strand rich effector domain